MIKELSNWGGYPFRTCNIAEPESYETLILTIKQHKQVIARGNGRCYGDSSLAPVVIQTSAFNSILSFNEMNGLLHCQAGILLSDILAFIVPKGFFLPVTPGTKLITAGGAFAADIHGKNHHKEGVFSDHVEFIKLINEEGEVLTLKHGDDLFYRTAGGMGATGVIIEMGVRLKRIETAYIRQTAIRAKNLKEIFDLFAQHQDATYSVAWIDCLAKGKHLGRSVLLLGEHATNAEVERFPKLKVHGDATFRIPFYFPSWVLSPLFVKCFNWLYYNKPSSSVKDAIIHYAPYFYPLDSIQDWNRIYGKRGFVQYQFVVPLAVSYNVMETVLRVLSEHNIGSFLAVLKLFGDAHEHRYWHFPMKGYTLALDIPVSDKIWALLDQLDTIVEEAGGKVYLTKDARMNKTHFDKQYRLPLQQNQTFKSYQMSRLESNSRKVILIFGASSDIAKEAALLYAQTGADTHLILASRNTGELQKFVADYGLEPQASVLYFDATDIRSHADFVSSLSEKPCEVLYAAGLLINNDTMEGGTNKWMEAATVNFTGAVSVLETLLRHENGSLIQRIVGVSSVAGLRGRKSNYLYGSTKAGFHAYLFGLRQRLAERGIVVQAMTPGFVQTKMTSHLDLPGNAVSAKLVGERIVLGKGKQFELYPNLYWKIIANLVKVLPQFIIAKI